MLKCFQFSVLAKLTLTLKLRIMIHRILRTMYLYKMFVFYPKTKTPFVNRISRVRSGNFIQKEISKAPEMGLEFRIRTS